MNASNPSGAPGAKAKAALHDAAVDFVHDVALPRAYAAAAKRPVNPRKVVFVEGKDVVPPEAFSVIMPWLRDRCDMDVRFVGLGQNTGIGNAAFFRRCRALASEVATARAIFLSDSSNVISCLPIRPETKVVQLWHACGAFKKWGASTSGLKFSTSRARLQRHPYYANLDLVTVSSPEVEWAYREAMMLEGTPEVVQPLGVSRTDAFFDDSFIREAHDAVLRAVPACAGKKIALYAPTFRGQVNKAQAPDALDFRTMRDALAEDWVLLVKHHPFVKDLPVIPDDCARFAHYVNDESISRLIAVADALVTDYSSVVFEFALFGKPMVFFSYDIDEYNDWRGFYYDYDEMTPGPIVTTSDEVARLIATAGDWFDPTVVAAFKDRFMRSCDGHATERICRAVFG